MLHKQGGEPRGASSIINGSGNGCCSNGPRSQVSTFIHRMFAIERFQLDEEAPAQPQPQPQQRRQDGRQGEHKPSKEGGTSRQQSQLLAEHLARVRARKEARLREQDGRSDNVKKEEKKKRKRVEGAAAELPAHEPTAPARGVQDDDGDGEKRKRKKKNKKEKQLPDDTSVFSPAPASEEAEAAAGPVVDVEMKRSSGLDAVRRLLSGHLMKGRAAPPAPPQPPQQAHERAAVAPAAGPPVPSVDKEEENPAKMAERKQKEPQREEKEQERAVAAEDGALSVGAACAKWGLDARLAPALEVQVRAALWHHEHIFTTSIHAVSYRLTHNMSGHRALLRRAVPRAALPCLLRRGTHTRYT